MVLFVFAGSDGGLQGGDDSHLQQERERDSQLNLLRGTQGSFVVSKAHIATQLSNVKSWTAATRFNCLSQFNAFSISDAKRKTNKKRNDRCSLHGYHRN